MRVSFLTLLLLPSVAATASQRRLQTVNVDSSGVPEDQSGVTLGTEEELSDLLITGWYPECDREFNCLGTKVESANPQAIDVTGNTCYVNPTAMDAVTWFSTLNFLDPSTPEGEQVFSFTITLNEALAGSVMPGPCTADGACQCGAFESVREGWQSITSREDFDNVCAGKDVTTSCNIWHTLVYSEGECNNNFWVEVSINGVLSRTCVLNASLRNINTTPSPTASPSVAPMPSPSATPAPTQAPRSCINLDTPGFQGNVTSAETCVQACGNNMGQTVIWDTIDGAFVNGTVFKVWRCTCSIDDETVFCSSILYEDGNITAPPNFPLDCFDLGVNTIGDCGIGCSFALNGGIPVDFTKETNENGDEYRKCVCASGLEYCESTRVATESPTQSPSMSLEPTLSPAPTRGFQFFFPTAEPSMVPTGIPSVSMEPSVSMMPSSLQTMFPSDSPSESPSEPPTFSDAPTESQSPSGSTEPTAVSSRSPTLTPSVSMKPSEVGQVVTDSPTTFPTTFPSMAPSEESAGSKVVLSVALLVMSILHAIVAV